MVGKSNIGVSSDVGDGGGDEVGGANDKMSSNVGVLIGIPRCEVGDPVSNEGGGIMDILGGNDGGFIGVSG